MKVVIPCRILLILAEFKIPFCKSIVNTANQTITNLWQPVGQCPACESSHSKLRQNLTSTHYVFGKKAIPLPEQGISLVQCADCSLVYKTIVPTKAYLLDIFNQQTEQAWSDHYHFRPEKTLIESLIAKPTFDLLDIGPAHGGLLKAFKDSGGKRAGLDVIQHTDVNAYLRGEFIQGLLEEPTLIWENEPYDMVTAFDIFEHLYQPVLAFANLRRLVKKEGFIVLETGDICNFWVKKFGLPEWWYVNLFEHHIFWSEYAFYKFVRQQGFEVIHFTRKRHKNLACLPTLNRMVATLKDSLYIISPSYYKKLMTALGKPSIQPFCIFTKDHFQAVLKKI
ncbi:MAG: hypothetical protein BWK79_06065 [Beggiatoa sp. IS2]|nr:MAG: hypothetical protein BWK79_06065 [Beggiatoa sp. IS2]